MIFFRFIPYVLLVVLIFVIINFISWRTDEFTKKDGYIASSEYDKYVTSIANGHIDNDIFEFDYSISSSNENSITLSYTFKTVHSIEEYESLAYDELSYVYDNVKDIKLKKDSTFAPRGKDLIFVFYTYENGQKKRSV